MDCAELLSTEPLGAFVTVVKVLAFPPRIVKGEQPSPEEHRATDQTQSKHRDVHPEHPGRLVGDATVSLDNPRRVELAILTLVSAELMMWVK